ncbi:hypothetical protein ACOSQ4_015116 [Xanthoceras sorbifolium]
MVIPIDPWTSTITLDNPNRSMEIHDRIPMVSNGSIDTRSHFDGIIPSNPIDVHDHIMMGCQSLQRKTQSGLRRRREEKKLLCF